MVMMLCDCSVNRLDLECKCLSLALEDLSDPIVGSLDEGEVAVTKVTVAEDSDLISG